MLGSGSHLLSQEIIILISVTILYLVTVRILYKQTIQHCFVKSKHANMCANKTNFLCLVSGKKYPSKINILSTINNGLVTIHGKIEFICVVNQLTLNRECLVDDPGGFNCNHKKH